MIAYCIFMNDNVEAVVLDNLPKAEKLLLRKKRDYFNRNKHAFTDFVAYTTQCFWHIHDIEVNES